jgi:hypothetical protein
MSRRDDAIVAWHEVPGRAPPQKIRPVGYGVILAGLQVYARIDLGLAAPNHTVPYGTVLSRTFSQALRARLRSYGTGRRFANAAPKAFKG